jgi:hypothetical protein
MNNQSNALEPLDKWQNPVRGFENKNPDSEISESGF